MEKLERKTLTTKRGYIYTYYSSPTLAGSSGPALLWLHGFPESAYMWNEVLPHFFDTPYRLIVPDLLGYGGTSKPLDVDAYAFSGQVSDLMDILAAENVTKVVSIGHDWGAPVAQRFYHHCSQLTVALVLLNVGYTRPTGDHFDLEAVNDMTKKVFGYSLLSYWNFFTSPNAPKIIEANLEKFWEILHTDSDEFPIDTWEQKDAWQKQLEGNDSFLVKAYAQQSKWKNEFIHRIRRDGIACPLLWYVAAKNNIQSKDDSTIPEARKDGICKIPFLFIGCTGDRVARPDLIQQPKMEGLLPDFEEKILDCGHWCAMEKPDDVAEAVKSFILRRVPAS